MNLKIYSPKSSYVQVIEYVFERNCQIFDHLRGDETIKQVANDTVLSLIDFDKKQRSGIRDQDNLARPIKGKVIESLIGIPCLLQGGTDADA